MRKFFQINLGRLHILLAKNDGIKKDIRNGRKKTSLRLDRVPQQNFFSVKSGRSVFFSGRIMHVFLDIDWI